MEIQKQVQSFRETLALSTKGVLKDKTRMAIRYSKVYHEDFAAPAVTGEQETAYDMTGRRVDDSYRGFIIKGGKKYFRK